MTGIIVPGGHVGVIVLVAIVLVLIKARYTIG
jgi:hypothetical protein